MEVRQRPDGLIDVLGVPIWSTGTFYGHGSPPGGDRFTEKDLDTIVQNMRELEEEIDPRLYAGHPLHPILKFLARPKGRLTNFRRQGQFLLADLVGVDPRFWEEAVRDGARLSPDMAVSYYSPRAGKRYSWVILGLGVLGAVPPANTLLPPLGAGTHYYAARAYAGLGEVRWGWVTPPMAVRLARWLRRGAPWTMRSRS